MKIKVEAFQLIGGVFLCIGYIPQIIKVFSTQSAKDFSLLSLCILATGIGLMEIYAWSLLRAGKDWAFFATNTVALVLSSTLAAAVYIYS